MALRTPLTSRCRRAAAALRIACVLLVACPTAAGARAETGAGLFVSATRLVFPGTAREASLQIHNENVYPVLVQTWVDAGDPTADPATIDVPFVVLPPLMRLQPNEARALRVVYTRQPLPSDRESVFWLNAQMIPPHPDDGAARDHVMEVSVRIRQKIFFRPPRLVGGSAEWIQRLDCRPSRQAELVIVQCRNPTPYFATIDRLGMTEEDGEFSALGDMLAPFGEMEFRLLKEGAALDRDRPDRQAAGRLSIAAIDDEGRVTVVVNDAPPWSAPPVRPATSAP
ncbi:chaperone protein EcpD [Variovorax sp. HW608]|nr:chaperone protein EcpD [Variovorax sp. HW608]